MRIFDMNIFHEGSLLIWKRGDLAFPFDAQDITFPFDANDLKCRLVCFQQKMRISISYPHSEDQRTTANFVFHDPLKNEMPRDG